jgi:hypothetical protein
VVRLTLPPALVQALSEWRDDDESVEAFALRMLAQVAEFGPPQALNSIPKRQYRNVEVLMKHQLFADYQWLLEALQRRLHKDVQNLPVEAMDWSPGPQMNSVAVLLAHITGVLHEGIDIALNDPPSRVREQEFQTRGVLSAEMLRRLDAVIDYARGALPRLGLEDLDKERG